MELFMNEVKILVNLNLYQDTCNYRKYVRLLILVAKRQADDFLS